MYVIYAVPYLVPSVQVTLQGIGTIKDTIFGAIIIFYDVKMQLGVAKCPSVKR